MTAGSLLQGDAPFACSFPHVSYFLSKTIAGCCIYKDLSHLPSILCEASQLSLTVTLQKQTFLFHFIIREEDRLKIMASNHHAISLSQQAESYAQNPGFLHFQSTILPWNWHSRLISLTALSLLPGQFLLLPAFCLCCVGWRQAGGLERSKFPSPTHFFSIFRVGYSEKLQTSKHTEVTLKSCPFVKRNLHLSTGIK
jgi:hypothetical protein